MKHKIVFTILLILGITFIVSLILSCNKDDENQTGEAISIEVKQQVPYIIYLDEDDLNSQIPEALSITDLSIPEDAIVFSHTINSEMSKITIRIDIKEEFQELYRFPENFENIFVIDIQDLESSLGDFLFDIFNSLNWQATPSQSTDMEVYLCQNIDNYDFQNASLICIPIAFHILEGANFQPSNINSIIETLNTAFINSKIQFIFDSSTIFNVSENTYNLININDVEDLPKEIDKLNIYVGDYLGLGNGIDNKIQALAHFPVFNVFTNAIFIRSRFINQTHYPNQPLLCHEIGHTFSLYHTFETNGYNHNQCSANYEGDGIIGTEIQNSYVPPQGSTCDDWNNSNYMSYSHILGYSNQCDYSFTGEQNKRMRFSAERWLSNIYCDSQQSEVPTVTTKEITNITETSAKSGGNIINNGGETITAKGVCWSTVANPTINDNVTNDGTGSENYTSSITGLIENTTYYVRAYATNSIGTSYGNELVFTTLSNNETVIDYDGNTYNVVQIGNQFWLKENLKTSHYRNGDVIPTGLTGTELFNTTEGAYKVFDNNLYGKLYNWFAITDNRGLCPSGYHSPSDTEWNILVNHLSTNAGGKLKSTSTLWTPPNTEATNSSGFTGLPGGQYRFFPDDFHDQNNEAIFWTSTETSSNGAKHYALRYDTGNIHIGSDQIKVALRSCRCVKD